jgi:hypothetical protein
MHVSPALSLVLLASTSALAIDHFPLPSSGHSPSQVTVAWMSDHSFSSAIRVPMERELQSVFSPAGISFLFVAVADSPQIYGQSVVLRFYGSCSDADVSSSAAPYSKAPDAGLGDRKLGITHIADGRVMPFAGVACDEVRSLVARSASLSYPSRNRIFAQALARVAAHELFHMFTADTGHGRVGLASATFSRSDLVATQASFSPVDLKRILGSPMVRAATIAEQNKSENDLANVAERTTEPCRPLPKPTFALGFVAINNPCAK